MDLLLQIEAESFGKGLLLCGAFVAAQPRGAGRPTSRVGAYLLCCFREAEKAVMP